MIELSIIGILAAAIGGYLLGYRDGNANGIRIMRDEFEADDNDDAKALSKVVTDAADGGASGAMHQGTIGHIMHWNRAGRSWSAYQTEMRAPRKEDAA